MTVPRRAFTFAGVTALAGLAAHPHGNTYSRDEIDALLVGAPYRVRWVGGWPELRPVDPTRPVEFIGPDIDRDSVPAWTVDDDTYLGYN